MLELELCKQAMYGASLKHKINNEDILHRLESQQAEMAVGSIHISLEQHSLEKKGS